MTDETRVGPLQRVARNIGSLAVALLVLSIVFGAGWAIVRPNLVLERNEYLRTFLTGIAALALLLQLRYTAASTRASTATLALTEQSQVTDRFYKAVEQLGRESSEVRMGALFALERISEDSDRDYHQVMSIIAAYIRQRASNRSHASVQL